MEDNSYYERQDKYLANFIVGYFFVQALNLLVKLVIGYFPMWTVLSRGSLILLLLLALKPMIIRNYRTFFATELVFLVLFAYTALFHNASYSGFNSIVMNAITVFIPMAIATVSIYDKMILLQRLYIMAWPTEIVLLVVLLTRSSYDYSMVGGYALVFQLLIILDHFFESRRWYDLASCLVALVVIFVYGSRGPILCVCAMVVIKILFNPSISYGRKLTFVVLTCAFVGIVVGFYDNIINHLLVLTKSLGYSSRNLRLLVNGRITSDSGRTAIHQYYLEVIKKGPALGYGLAGGWMANGVYPHNVILELLVSFGLVFGVLICVGVVLIGICAIKCSDERRRRLSHILFAYSVSLLLSDTFLKSPTFFMLMWIGFQSLPVRFSFKTQEAMGKTLID